jgi:integrase
MTDNDKKINFTKAALDALQHPSTAKRTYYYDIKTRGLGISITSTGAKSFIVYRWVNGKPERITLGRYPDLSIEQARRKAAEVNATIAKGENPNDKRRADRAEMTLGQLKNEYIERYAKLHKITWRDDEAQFKRYLKHWENRKLSQIQKRDIQKLHMDIGNSNGHYAANRLLALLSTLFNKAIEFSLWEKSNPVTGIKKFREKSRDRFLQADELPRFFEALANEPNELVRDCILMSLLTGARRANVHAMRWEEIDFKSREWHIPNTKNQTPQTVTLTDEAIAVLRRREQHKVATNPHVFPGVGSSGHVVEPKKIWQRILINAKIENLRLHDLRRTLGSWQARMGASLAIIGKSLNHKSPSATAIYARLDLDPVRDSVEKATNAMFATIQNTSEEKTI